MNLPELPPHDLSGYPSKDDPDERLSYSSDAMREYGQACAQAARDQERDRCAKLCIDMSAYTGGHGEPSAPDGRTLAAAIRATNDKAPPTR